MTRQRGQSVAEYALIFFLVVVVVVFAYIALGNQVSALLRDIGDSIGQPSPGPLESISAPLGTPTPTP